MDEAPVQAAVCTRLGTVDLPVLTRGELRASGRTDGWISHALRRGALVRVGRDRYVLPGVVPTPEQVIARAGTDTALSHASAARAWGLPASDRRTHVVVPHGARRRGPQMRSVTVHQSRAWQAEVVDGVAVTPPSATVLDIARGGDLAESVVVLDAALRQGLVGVGELGVALSTPAPSNDRARRALALADGRAESPLESRLRLLLTLGHLPPDDLQRRVFEGGAAVARVDLWYDGLVVEADGFEHHRERADFLGDRAKGQAFARLDLRLLRFSWEDVLARPDEVLSTVRTVLAHVERRAA